MEKYVTIAEMQAVEKEANEKGLTYSGMMENAGKGLAEWINNAYSYIEKQSIIALVGTGNNGGDALVALSRLIEMGWTATAYLLKPRSEADTLVQMLIARGGTIVQGAGDPTCEGLMTLLRDNAVLIDGALGTGVRFPLPEEIAQSLNVVKNYQQEIHSRLIVIAVDCPSGVQCDSGECAPETIPADVTYTMAGIKIGLLKFPAANLVGEIQVGSIGDLENNDTWLKVTRGVLSHDDITKIMPARPRDAHKGTFGTTLVVGGSGNYPGSILLAGEAAYRIGAGLVTIAVPELIHASVIERLVEATWIRLPHLDGWISRKALPLVKDALGSSTSLLVGPGIGLHPSTGDFLAGVIKDLYLKTVIDADALKLLSNIPNWDQVLSSEVVLTPHPGEMAILTGLPKEEIQSSRIEVAEAYSKKWQKVVVLKGAYTVIAAPGEITAVVPVATPALAKAGTGDVLAGIIAGLLAQGLDVYDAACAGCWIHAQAGLEAEKIIGSSNAVLAGDVIKAVPNVIKRLE